MAFTAIPNVVLENIIFHIDCSLRLIFLASLGSRIHSATVYILFKDIAIQDDESSLQSMKDISHALFCNPSRYGPAVQDLTIINPTNDQAAPLGASRLCSLLEYCSNITQFSWKCILPPPNSLGEILSRLLPKLSSFSYSPPRLSSHRASVPRWDGESLPLMRSLPLRSISISRLSQAGAHAFSSLLIGLGDESILEKLSLDFTWLDDQLCESVVAVSRQLKLLFISTSGTKLSDKGVMRLLEGCEALQELSLDDIEGRLSRSMWSGVISFPVNFQRLNFVLSETGPHHSWTADHVGSIPLAPIERLTSLSIVRREINPTIHNDTALYLSKVDDVTMLKPAPISFMDQISSARHLSTLQCDFFSCSISEVKLLLERCTQLETLTVCLGAPFSKLLGLTSTFATASKLRVLSVSVDAVYAPGRPPSLQLSQSTVPASKLHEHTCKTKATLPHLLDFEHMQSQTCVDKLSQDDPSMPLLRDVKRFSRKCPRLELLEWYGKYGRGSWIVSRPTSTKTSMNVTVRYEPPTITPYTWESMRADKEHEYLRKWSTESQREGQEWQGEAADALALELQAEPLMELSVESLSQGACSSREHRKKERAPSISTSSSSASDSFIPLTPVRSSSSGYSSSSPIQIFTQPTSVSHITETTILPGTLSDSHTNWRSEKKERTRSSHDHRCGANWSPTSDTSPSNRGRGVGTQKESSASHQKGVDNGRPTRKTKTFSMAPGHARKGVSTDGL